MSEISNMTSYNATCGTTGTWSILAGCSLVSCHPLQYLSNTTEIIEILETPISGMGNVLNSKLRVSCQNEGDDFDFGFNILSVEYLCGHRFNNKTTTYHYYINIKYCFPGAGKCLNKMPVQMNQKNVSCL
jgi:hypothetical protein